MELLECPYCGMQGELLWVHGLVLCPHCKSNVDEYSREEVFLDH